MTLSFQPGPRSGLYRSLVPDRPGRGGKSARQRPAAYSSGTGTDRSAVGFTTRADRLLGAAAQAGQPLSAAAGGYSSGPARPRGLAAQRPPAPGTVLSVPPAGQPPPGTTVLVTAALPHPDTAMGTITGNGDGQGDGPGNQPSARADSPRMPPSRPAGGRRWAQARVHPPVRWAAP